MEVRYSHRIMLERCSSAAVLARSAPSAAVAAARSSWCSAEKIAELLAFSAKTAELEAPRSVAVVEVEQSAETAMPPVLPRITAANAAQYPPPDLRKWQRCLEKLLDPGVSA